MRTAVVILNWNTRDYLERFLPPLLESVRGLDAAVVVADNASTDGSRELLAERFPEVRTLLLEENFGFTGGYNRAFAQLLAGPDAPGYLVLLNSDIEVGPGWLEPLVAWMDAHPDYAACGPKLHALVRDGGD
ncbi:MAG: glycosyltransferase, partial [Bacteroidales bacterium]|nr:glycosyltransferase [Bacteroidales bacterium]